MKRTPIDADDLRRLYDERLTIKEIADRLGSSPSVIWRRLGELGLSGERRHWIDSAEVVALYNSGRSVKALAGQFGVSRQVIDRRLKRAGITPRGRSESMYLRMSQTSEEERGRLSAAAHAAVRGKRQTFEHRCKIARSREASPSCVSRIERVCLGVLEDHGFACTPQKAVGPYNIDVAIGVPPIAVEIFGGHWHASGSHAGRFRKRTDYILDAGWVPVYVWVTRDYPFEVGAVEYIVALAEQMRRGEPVRREEHMIRGDGEITTIGERNLNGLPVIPGPQPRDNTTGRFRPRSG